MKPLLKVAMLVLLLLFFNCSNDDDSGNSSQEFSPEMLNGTWRISFFSDEVEERTTEFNDYQFTFNVEEETAIIRYNGISETSSIEVFIEDNFGDNFWVVYTGFDGVNNPGDADLDDLVEDWFITNVNDNATVIQFEELYSNNTPEILHLTKISEND